MRNAIGFLYYWKGIILIVTLLLSIIIYRPFCKYICPLGAIYSIFNPISIFRYRLDTDKCINCGKCKIQLRIAIIWSVSDVDDVKMLVQWMQLVME